MRKRRFSAAGALAAMGAWGFAVAGDVLVPREWRACERLRIPVVRSDASGFLGPEYAPARAHDGDRRTKWVAPERPSAERPQWIALDLGEAREVSAVAVFGEAVTNDGVIDAEIQAEIDGAFRAVSAVRGMASASWLVSFDPVRTARLRLLVTRSGGPSEHTDVYEVEVYGGALSPEEVREEIERSARARLEETARLRASAKGLARAPGEAAAEVRGSRALLVGSGSAVETDLESGRSIVAWEGADVAVVGAGCAFEVGGAEIAAGKPEASVRGFEDPLGRGRELRQVWRSGAIRLEREIRVYGGHGAVTVGGRVANEGAGEAILGTARLLRLEGGGSWLLGSAAEPPAAVYVEGHAMLRSRPFDPLEERGVPKARSYHSGGILALAAREPAAALVFGCVRADAASPDLAAEFEAPFGGTALEARMRFFGRVLGPGESLELNRVYLSASPDIFSALEAFGDALGRCAARPPRTRPTALWCSWYAHRMAVSEELVLANAEVAARHLAPLGLEIIQIDHGWQRGDVTGDWFPNERFPRGLRWLADELRRRHGLRLGLWISPTDVAETSDLFREHPDWMLRGADGKPRVNWRWYWKPNPDCYELDATRPEAARFIEETFRRLRGEGVEYFKIDFIAASASEAFLQSDPRSTRGWSVLKRAMEAVRAGAGDGAWIRYCQTPPVLSAGLADSAYGGPDTLDAGIPGRFDVLRENAAILAASFFLNGRAYRREVCDMSLRMHAGVEEARLRAALMVLAGTSISFSDELSYLPPSRIRLQKQCLPPGAPPMRPIDLLERDIPSVWHLAVRKEEDSWDVVGLFNFSEREESREVSFERLGLDPESAYAVFEFWEERFLGIRRGGIEVRVPPEACRVLSVRRALDRPQLVGTDMHLLQGYHDLAELRWDAEAGVLSGLWRRAPGEEGKAFFLVPEGWEPRFDFPLSSASARLTRVGGLLWMQELTFREAEVRWSIPFERRG